MSVGGLLNTTVSLWLASTTQDASGGMILTPFVISPTFQGVPATIQAAKSSIINRYKQAQIDVTNTIYTGVNTGALPQQLIVEDSTGRTFVVEGARESTAGYSLCWEVDCRETAPQV